jgi:hypothetical protein
MFPARFVILKRGHTDHPDLGASRAPPNYRRASVKLFVLAYFVRSPGEVQGVRKALGLPLRVARLTVPVSDIEQRLASDVTSGRQDDLREAASSIATAEGTGVEDVTIRNDRPIEVVARDVMTFLGWL